MAAMSVPAWKQAILERRKKAEDEEKKKHAEEEAFLATLPPWKRALLQKRERERQQHERDREMATGAAAERSSSFQKRQQELAQEREERERRSQRGWGRRVTPPSSESGERAREPSSPTSPPPHGHTHQFFPASSGASSQQQQQKPWQQTRRRASVTTLPGADEPIAAKVVAVRVGRPRAASESTASTASKKVVSSVKKLNEVKTAGEIPAWKKALLQRKREKERTSGGIKLTPSPPEDSTVTVKPVTRKGSPQDGAVEEDGSSVTGSSLALKRKPSPEEDDDDDDVVITPVPEPLQLQRKPSPVESIDSTGRRSSVEQIDETTADQEPTQPERAKLEPESKPPMTARKTSAIETVGGVSKPAQSMPKRRASDTSVRTASTAAISGANSEPRRIDRKPTPVRVAPTAPTTGGTNTAQSKPAQFKQQKTPSTRPQQRKVPEVVNRGVKSDQPSNQSQVMQTEGVTHRAPVYKEVSEWANVLEDDEKFQSLPTWKQALIRRRRADIAKRSGITTSVDDVPLTNGPVPSGDVNVQGVPSENRTAGNPPWKQQMMRRKTEGGSAGQNVMSNFEKKHLSTRRDPPTNPNSNVKALLGRFTSPAPVTKITSSHPPRSPSPSSPPPHSSPATTSTTGVPPPSSSGHTIRKTFTWTPGETTMPGEALSDSSDGEEEEDEVTNLDDTSEEEEEEEDEREGGNEIQSVVLLGSSQSSKVSSVAGGEDTAQRVRKTSSILVTSPRPRKRVSTTLYHYYHTPQSKGTIFLDFASSLIL